MKKTERLFLKLFHEIIEYNQDDKDRFIDDKNICDSFICVTIDNIKNKANLTCMYSKNEISPFDLWAILGYQISIDKDFNLSEKEKELASFPYSIIGGSEENDDNDFLDFNDLN